jgi:hypothetical protein
MEPSGQRFLAHGCLSAAAQRLLPETPPSSLQEPKGLFQTNPHVLLPLQTKSGETMVKLPEPLASANRRYAKGHRWGTDRAGANTRL